MRNKISRLLHVSIIAAKRVKRDLVEDKQEEIKRVYDAIGGPSEWDIRIGDFVRVLDQENGFEITTRS